MATANTMWDPNKGDIINPVFNSITVLSGTSQAPIARPLLLTDAKTDAGVVVAGTAVSGAFGISRTAGTSLLLLAETASSSTKTDKAFFEVDLPGGYIVGTPLPVIVNANVGGSGTFTASTTVLSVSGFSESNSGTETALTTTVSGGSATSAQVTSGAADYAFVVSGGTAFTPGARIGIGVSMTVVNTAGTNTGQINGARIVA